MSQTKKSVTPVAITPFTEVEIRELDKLVKAPVKKRAEMQKAFREKYGRSTKDVGNYVYRRRNGTTKSSGLETLKSVKKGESPKRASKKVSKGEITFELPIKRIEFVGGVMIITASRD